MSNLGVSTEIMQELNAQAVPSLFQLALSWISNQSLWSFAQDIPETAVPGLLKKIKHTDFDLDLLPNLLPASLQHLDLTGYYTLTEDTLLAIIKKCFSITELILNDVPLITQHVVPQIFWYLPDLTYLSLGAGVGSLAMLEMVKRPIQLRYLAINSASMDEMWLEQLRYFPDLITLKLRNVTIPKIQSVPFKLPPHLASINISNSSHQKLSEEHVNLFTYFLTHVPTLQEFVIKYYNLGTVKEIGPIVARDLRVLRGKSGICVSDSVSAAIDDTCQSLEEVSGLYLWVAANESKQIGLRTLTLGGNLDFTYTTKKLTFDYTTITSADMAWKEGPTAFSAPLIAIFVFPLDPCYSLRYLKVSTRVDLVEILELFPNLEELILLHCTIVLDKKQKDPTQILGSRLKSLTVICNTVPEGAIDILSRSKVLKKVTLLIPGIHEFNKKKLHLDNVLRRFPFVEKLNIIGNATSITILNGDKKKWMDPDLKNIITDHPLRELSFKRNRELNENENARGIQLKNIDFNQYKNLQVLKFHSIYLYYGVKLPSRLRVLEEDAIKTIHESTKIPLNLYHLTWKSTWAFSRIVDAMKEMKNLRSVLLMTDLQKKAHELYGNDLQYGFPIKLKYMLPRRSEISKTNLLSAFTGIKKEMSPMEKLPALLKSSGSNLTMKDVQLIAEMYSKQEISLHSDQPVVRVRIRLTSGAIMNIQCNPSHRVIDLYAYARHAVTLGDKAFDLVVPPRTILDLSTYDKTVKDLGLTNTTLIQKIRESTPVENELRSYSLFHSQIINFGKDKSDGLSSSHDQSIRKSGTTTVNNTNNSVPDNKDEISMDDSEASYGSVSDNEEQEDMSGDDDDSDDMQMSDDDDDLDMYYGAEKVEKKEEITGENKYLLDQMNANMMRQSIEYHEKKEREEREGARLKFEAEQKKIEEEKERMRQFLGRAAPRYHNNGFVPFDYQIHPNPPPQPLPQQPINFVPAQQPNPLNAGFMTDEEMARMLQEEEYLNNFD